MYLVLGCDCNLRAMFSDTIFVILKIASSLGSQYELFLEIVTLRGVLSLSELTPGPAGPGR